MKPNAIVTYAVVASLAVGVGMFFMANSSYPDWSRLKMLNFALSGSMAALSFGATVLFLSGLKDFKTGPRKAYRFLCAGIILFGIAQVQTPLMQYFELFFLFKTGLLGVPYLLSVFMIFLGMRAFAKSLGIHTKWTQIRWVTVVAIVAAALSTILPHVPLPEAITPVIRIIGALAVWDVVFCAFAARIAWMIRRDINPLYKNAMSWLLAALVATSLAAVHFLFVQLVLFGTWYEIGGMVIVPFLIAAILYVVAGYAMLALQVRLHVTPTSYASHDTLLNIVMYMVGLVSVPKDIDASAESIREVTATIKNSTLSDAQRQTLYAVYRDIETYLVARDPIKIMDVAPLRATIIRDFKPDADLQAKLWPQAPAGATAQNPQQPHV